MRPRPLNFAHAFAPTTGRKWRSSAQTSVRPLSARLESPPDHGAESEVVVISRVNPDHPVLALCHSSS